MMELLCSDVIRALSTKPTKDTFKSTRVLVVRPGAEKAPRARMSNPRRGILVMMFDAYACRDRLRVGCDICSSA